MIKDIHIIADSSASIEAMQCYPPFFGQKVMIGLSGGINSMAVLCWLKESEIKVSELHLFYAHFKEHSPDTFSFVADGIRYARKHFENVFVKITRNSIIEYFREQNIIPHPTNSPCSKNLKIIPMANYCIENGIKFDLIGYVKREMKTRAERQQKNLYRGLFDAQKIYSISEFDDEWCFEIVDRNIGWHPAIYDIRWTEEDYENGLCSKRDIGQRVFKHNNCLPCKNMQIKDMKAVKKHYPTNHNDAMSLSFELKKYWGRVEDDFYFTFGRDLGQESTCEACRW